MLAGNMDILFGTIAVIFAVLWWRDRRAGPARGTVGAPRRPFPRIAVVFALVAVYLFLSARLGLF